MRKLKLAIVCYVNSLPLSWGFIHNRPKDRFELEFSPPALCADKMAAGSVDIGLIPAIAYQRIPNLRIIPNLSVASKGSVRSVLLVSKVPWSRIRTVALDQSSRTSVALLRILLRMRCQLDPTLYSHEPELASMLRRRDAALLIGDAALTADTAGLYRYDLSEAWREETGKPFVFAFWACRADSGMEDGSPSRNPTATARPAWTTLSAGNPANYGCPPSRFTPTLPGASITRWTRKTWTGCFTSTGWPAR